MSCDSEGNGYSPLRVIALSAYKDGEIGLFELTAEDEKRGYGEEDVLTGGERACVLWP